MYYYVLDYSVGKCDIFLGDDYEETYDIEEYLISLGYDLDNIAYMTCDTLNYNVDVSFRKVAGINSDVEEEDLINWENNV